MGIVIDIIIALISVAIIVKAYKSGLVKSVMGLIRGVVSFVAAYAFTPMLGDYFYQNWALKWISGGIEKSVRSMADSGEGSFNLSKMLEDMPDMMRQIIDRYGASESELGAKFSGVTEGTDKAVAAFADYIAQPVADMLSSAAAFLAIFAAVFIVLSIVTAIIDSIFKLPVLSGANKLLGVVFGVVEAGLVAVLISSAVSVAMTALGSVNPELFGEHVLDGSIILKYLSSVDLFGLLESVIR